MSFRKRIFDAVRRRIRHLRVLRKAREASLRRIQEVSSGKILVLCYGNIYRSPFVEHKLRSLLAPDRWVVTSAGFHEKSERTCAPEFVMLAKRYGVSLDDHRSNRVIREQVHDADIVIIMDRKNWDHLQDLEPDATEKIVWIGGALPVGGVEVEDPYGCCETRTVRIVQRMNDATDNLARLLR